jgi:plastocyanin
MNVLYSFRQALRALALPSAIALGLLMLVVGAALVGRDEAQAANSSVTVGNPVNRFSSNVSNINAGDTVTFTWAAGTHVVDLKDVSPDINSDSTHTSGTTAAFTTPGTYYYYCSIHASEALATEAHVLANDAMVGKIVVASAPGAAPSAPTAAPSAPGTGTGVAGGSDTNELAAVALLVGACLVLVGATALAVERK